MYDSVQYCLVLFSTRCGFTRGGPDFRVEENTSRRCHRRQNFDGKIMALKSETGAGTSVSFGIDAKCEAILILTLFASNIDADVNILPLTSTSRQDPTSTDCFLTSTQNVDVDANNT